MNVGKDVAEEATYEDLFGPMKVKLSSFTLKFTLFCSYFKLFIKKKT